jgi:hypothetical protein
MSLTALGDLHAAVDLFRLAYETRPVSARRAHYNVKRPGFHRGSLVWVPATSVGLD